MSESRYTYGMSSIVLSLLGMSVPLQLQDGKYMSNDAF
jgi:hypothetical protein